MIEVTALGTGATMPTPGRSLSAAVLRCGGRSMLIDCGEGTQVALRRATLSPVKIDLIALTHYHGDHVFGLPGLLQTISCCQRTEPLTITGPEGLREAMEPILSLAGELSFEIRLREAPDEGVDMAEFHSAWPRHARLASFPVLHRVSCRGYAFMLSRPGAFDARKAMELGIPVSLWRRIQADPDAVIRITDTPMLHPDGTPVQGTELLGPPRQGLKVVFSGDTRPCAPLLTAASGADLLVHDATYALDSDQEDAQRWGHSTFRQAAETARRAGAARLWLTHFSQAINEPESHLAIPRSVFPETVCARDGMSLTLNFSE